MQPINDTVAFEIKESIGLIQVDNPPVNALGFSVREGLARAIEKMEGDDEVRAIIIGCLGKTFFSGADIREFGKPGQYPDLPSLVNQIENCHKPVVAAMHGTVLGGGLEVAMACHVRIAASGTRMGLPEVKLGLLPGAGGTQRLPRLVGVEQSLKMITEGQSVDTAQALASGLIDAVASGDLIREAVELIQKTRPAERPIRRVRKCQDKIQSPDNFTGLFEKTRMKIQKRHRGFNAPVKCLDAVEACVRLPFEEGTKKERELFLELLSDPQSAAQRHIFFAERKVHKIPDIPKDTPRIPIRATAIIGAGTMGGGIAMTLANVGIPVTIVDLKPEYLDRCLSVIRKNYQISASKGKLTAEDIEKRMSLISTTVSMDNIASADLVIEAVFENMKLKKEIFANLDKICKQGAVLASNTSYQNIDELAAQTGRPEYVLGLHFFSPANVMRLLEIVRGAETSKSVLATAMDLARKIGKISVMVGVCYGFASNRMYLQRCREDSALVLEGASTQQVDRVIYDFGFPIGPFALYDLIGVDVRWDRENTSSSTVREILCETGRLGQKTGAGFYRYEPGNRTPISDPYVDEIILELAAKKNIQRREIGDEEILKRCLYAVINEGAKIIEEGIAVRPSDLDVIWVNGYGWPGYLGGPMYYADTIGLDNILADIKTFEKELGDVWQPAHLLEKLVEEGKSFEDLNHV